MDLEKIYYDIDGNECNILNAVKKSPEWAANRIQVGESAIKKLEKLNTFLESYQYMNDVMTVFQIKEILGKYPTEEKCTSTGIHGLKCSHENCNGGCV